MEVIILLKISISPFFKCTAVCESAELDSHRRHLDSVAQTTPTHTSPVLGQPSLATHQCLSMAVLFGSRVMAAKEAHTSKNAKQAIVDAQGLDDADWEKTYKGPAGGVITVRSEMGEPIHKLATRGVIFWAEMDKKIFSLDKAKRVPELKKKREYIIEKLNEDFQKVWFGMNKQGVSVDLEDMTYTEVVQRMVELMYVKHRVSMDRPSSATLDW